MYLHASCVSVHVLSRSEICFQTVLWPCSRQSHPDSYIRDGHFRDGPVRDSHVSEWHRAAKEPASEIGEVMALAKNSPVVQGVFKGLHRRQGGLWQPYFGAAVQNQRRAKTKIPTPVEPQHGNFAQWNTGAALPAEPTDLIFGHAQAGSGIAPQLPEPGQGGQGQERRHQG